MNTILLDDYEVANLRAAFEAIGYGQRKCESCGSIKTFWPIVGDSPLNVLNSGDWLGQIYNKLPELSHAPNVKPEEYAQRARDWKSPS